MATTWTQELRAQASLSNTYARGAALARSGAVLSCDARRAPDGLVELSGTVRGSSGQRYAVSLTLDEDANAVIADGCTCLAYASYPGMCKHAIALALAYTGADGIARAARKPAFTSPQIERLVARYADQALVASRAATDGPGDDATAAIDAEPVDLVCVISPAEAAWRYSWTSDTWALGLKVVRGKVSYVVKSVAELVDRWHTGAVHRYGKNLEFAHRRAAFTDRANALLELLSGVVDAQASLYAAQEGRRASYYQYYPSNRVPEKTLPLSSAQLIDVLDLMQGQRIVVEREDPDAPYSRRMAKRTVAVTTGSPKLDVALTSVQPDAYDLAIRPASLVCVADGARLYLMGDREAMRCDAAFVEALGPFCTSVLPLKEDVLHIRQQDMPAFCAAVLPALRRHANLSEPDGLDGFLPPEAEFTFRIGRERGYVSCVASVCYGGDRLSLYDDVYVGQVARDVSRETAVQQVVRTYFPLGDHTTPNYGRPWPEKGPNAYELSLDPRPRHVASLPGEPDAPCFHEDDDTAYYLLFSDGLRELSRVGEVMLSDRLQGVTVRQSPSVRVDASVRSGLLDIAVSSDDMDPAELAAYLAAYRRRQRYVRLSNGDIMRLDGSVGAVAELAEGLGLDAGSLVEGVSGLSANRTLFVDAMLKRAGGVHFERNRAFRKIVRDFETVADADFVPPAALRDVLRPYQTEGFRWLCTLGKSGFGGILADDMGLGKTLQTIAYLAHERDGGSTLPALVVCPASLVYNWRAECARFAPELDVVCVAGTKAARRRIVSSAAEHDLLITSYDLLRRDIDDLASQRLSCVVLDEAQYIKNSSAKVTRAAKRLDAGVRLALTGTPIENRLSELWSIFDFLMPGVLGTADAFARRFSTPIGNGDEDAAIRLRRLVGPFILRRLKGDVLRDLPDKSESVVYADMDGEQGKLYRANEQRLALMLRDQPPGEFAGERLKILAELTKLRQICCDPHLLYDGYAGGSAKLDTCVELVRQAVEGGHQLLLFSQFTSMLQLVAERLNAERVAWLRLTGATSKEERVRLVERFQAGEAPVFLISLKAGGTGLNLTAADVVIHYDPWWNLAAQNQATDRTHRIGQTREVSVFKLIAKGTIEERIVRMQEAKRDLAESVLGGEAVGGTAITRDDVLALLEAGDA